MLNTNNFVNSDYQNIYFFIIKLIKYWLSRDNLIFVFEDFKKIKAKDKILQMSRDIFAEEYYERIERYIQKLNKTLANKNIFEYIEIPFYNNYLFRLHALMNLQKKDMSQVVTELLQFYESHNHTEINRIVDSNREKYNYISDKLIINKISNIDWKEVFIHNLLFKTEWEWEYIYNFRVTKEDHLSKYFIY